MDKELFEKYKLGESPFSGSTLFTSSRVELDELRILVKEIIDFLQEKGMVSESVFKGWDWFEHDGYFHPKELVPSEILTKLTKSVEEFYQHRAGDSFVKLGLLDESHNWYLRVFIEDEYEIEDDDVLDGTMDISGDEDFISELKHCLEKKNKSNLSIEVSKEFFEKRYAGTK